MEEKDKNEQNTDMDYLSGEQIILAEEEEQTNPMKSQNNNILKQPNNNFNNKIKHSCFLLKNINLIEK